MWGNKQWRTIFNYLIPDELKNIVMMDGIPNAILASAAPIYPLLFCQFQFTSVPRFPWGSLNHYGDFPSVGSRPQTLRRLGPKQPKNLRGLD